MTLWQMSLSGAIMIGAVTLLRPAMLRLLPRRALPWMWGLVLLRLLVPITIPVSASVPGLIAERISGFGAVGQAAAELVSSAIPTSGAERASGPPWLLIWGVGALLCGGIVVFLYGHTLRKLAAAIPVRSDAVDRWLRTHHTKREIFICQSDQVSAPMTYGLIHPSIVLPKSMDLENETAVAYVLLHESIHIRRWDGMRKLTAMAALCVHWFNPLVWVMVSFLDRDIELACDEEVVRTAGENHRSDYARLLIHMEERKSGLTPLGSGFSKTTMEERIRAIMKMRKMTARSVIMGGMVLVILAAVFFTSAASKSLGKTAMDQLVESISSDGSQITFQIPADLADAVDLVIHIAGRAEYDDGFSRSLHFWEGERWQPGVTYAIPWDPSYTELWMDVSYTGAEGEGQEFQVELLDLVGQ